MNPETKYINFKKYWSFKQNQGNSSDWQRTAFKLTGSVDSEACL